MSKQTGLFVVLIIILGALSACGQLSIPSLGTDNTSTNTQTSLSEPNTQSPANNEGFSTPIVAPPSIGQRPLKPGETPAQQTLPNGLPALKPLKGVNVDKLFAERIGDTGQRFDRLENVVKSMRKEFEAVKPAIVRLVAVESDIQALVEQLEALAVQERSQQQGRNAPVALVEESPISQTPQQQKETNSNPTNQLNSADLSEAVSSQGIIPKSNAKPSETSVKAQNPKPPVTSSTSSQTTNMSGLHVKNLRTGIHADKVRLVLDMSAKTSHSIDVDPSENILILELPNAKWGDASSKNFGSKTPILSSYNTSPMNDGKGVRVILQLKQTPNIMKSDIIPPGPANKNHRLYIDLKR